MKKPLIPPVNGIQTFVYSFVEHVKDGLQRVTQEEINNRLNICENCDKYIKEQQICSVCGCNCNGKQQLLNKLAWNSSKCPLNKW